MSDPVTAVEAWRFARRGRLNAALIVLALLFLIGLVAVAAGLSLVRLLTSDYTPAYARIDEHFMYGSIGAEPASGMPYQIWRLLPTLYPEEFKGRQDYSAFGFLYEADQNGHQRDLPIGISRRNYSGVDLVWLNCATCHTGTWRMADGAERHIVLGMPSNNLDFHRLVKVVLRLSTDDRLAPDRLFPLIEAQGYDFGFVEKLIWRTAVLPRFREGLLKVRAGLDPLMEVQPAWGPGRVDTFNPYKVIQFDLPPETLTEAERIGAADLPAIFDQRPREGMQLHWDGNNASLQERNLSAAIGAGVTPETVDHAAIERIADWLGDLAPPPSPHTPEPTAVERGRKIYMGTCARCHGWKGADRYVFEGANLGQVTPNSDLGTDAARLNSYTEALRQRQFDELFAGTRYVFRRFTKTDGYANLPLDGLWLRGPYLHNGSVPTLADILKPPAERPQAYLRSSDVVDGVNGGFVSALCDPAAQPDTGLCYDTTLRGNGAGGHLYGTDLPAEQKAALLAYLLTF
ncbi:hypothetical protein GOC69_12200 [Sinorhizobium medicae]|nr:hypothetical protein [Sinorhizobium medicae]MDX0475207.1 hypothetical protein [Sinorhizobium medicae]